MFLFLDGQSADTNTVAKVDSLPFAISKNMGYELTHGLQYQQLPLTSAWSSVAIKTMNSIIVLDSSTGQEYHNGVRWQMDHSEQHGLRLKHRPLTSAWPLGHRHPHTPCSNGPQTQTWLSVAASFMDISMALVAMQVTHINIAPYGTTVHEY